MSQLYQQLQDILSCEFICDYDFDTALKIQESIGTLKSLLIDSEDLESASADIFKVIRSDLIPDSNVPDVFRIGGVVSLLNKDKSLGQFIYLSIKRIYKGMAVPRSFAQLIHLLKTEFHPEEQNFLVNVKEIFFEDANFSANENRKASKWLEILSDEGNQLATFCLGSWLADVRDWNRAIEVLTPLSDNNQVEAMDKLATIFRNSPPTPQSLHSNVDENLYKCLAMRKKAAELGHAKSCRILWHIYSQEGIGNKRFIEADLLEETIELNQILAVSWLILAIELDDVDAMRILGSKYLTGFSTENLKIIVPNKRHAFVWFGWAASEKNKRANSMFQRMCKENDSLVDDFKELEKDANENFEDLCMNIDILKIIYQP